MSTTMEGTPKKKPGRPPKAKNKEREEVVSEIVRCPKCRSTNRGKYHGKQIDLAYSSFLCGTCKESSGRENAKCYCGGHHTLPFTHIVKRRCDCKDCGQSMMVRSYENRK